MCPPASASDEPSSLNNDISAALLALVPQHEVCQASLRLAQTSLPASIFNHSFRVYLYALAFTDETQENVSPLDSRPVKKEVLFVASILHDLGTAPQFNANPARFEVCGADAAATLLRPHFSADEGRDAWLAIALHTSPGVAERVGGLVYAVRMGVRVDFGSASVPEVADCAELRAVEQAGGMDVLLPRLGVEKEVGDVLVRQAVAVRSKAPGGSWPGDLLRAWEAEPDWDGINKAY
jgi:hypothetical protein